MSRKKHKLGLYLSEFQAKCRAEGKLRGLRQGQAGKNTLKGLTDIENSVMYVTYKGKRRKAKPLGVPIYNKDQFYTAFRTLKALGFKQPYEQM